MQLHIHVEAAPSPTQHTELQPAASLTTVFTSKSVLPLMSTPPLQPFHGDKELIESDDVLLVPATAVQGRVRVLGLDAFQGLKRVGAVDYFARLAFKVGPDCVEAPALG